MSSITDRIADLSPLKLALLARKMRDGIDGLEYVGAEPIAIVGMSCRYPGDESDDADSSARFWRNLSGGIDAFRRGCRTQLPHSCAWRLPRSFGRVR